MKSHRCQQHRTQPEAQFHLSVQPASVSRFHPQILSLLFENETERHSQQAAAKHQQERDDRHNARKIINYHQITTNYYY